MIPFALGRALYERLEGPKRFVTIAGSDHNDAAPPDGSAPAYATGTCSVVGALPATVVRRMSRG